MPVRMSIRIDTKPMDGYRDLLKNAQRANEQIMAETVAKHESDYLAPMRDMDPGPSQHGAQKGAWSTNPAADERARAWYWYAVNNRLIPSDPVTGAYIRTGQLNRQWRLTARGNRLSMENLSAVSAYVFSFAQNIRARGGKPNPGHIRTGHPLEAQVMGTQVLTRIIADTQVSWAQSIAASVAAGQYRIVVP
ncbi:MAG: hypothetical protein CL610_06095 [Anaerolineaceae bacterium]|nr:hypothetical protein [Anaerolineaceae bacterium]